MRISVVGGGAIGETHCLTIREQPGMALAGLADPAPGAAATAAGYGARAYANHRDLIAAEKPDGAVIATPNALHVTIGKDFLDAGIPILVEKPVANTVAEGAELAAHARARGVPVLVGHHRRHHPAIRKARDLVAEGALGRIVTVTISASLMKPDGYFEAGWRRQPGVGGPLLINAIHEIDLLRFILGEITEVSAFASNATRGFPVEDTAALIFRFASGALGALAVSDTAAAPWSWDLSAGDVPRFPKHDVVSHMFAGTHGGLSLPRLELWRHPGARDWTSAMTPQAIAVAPRDPFVAQLEHFAAVIRGDESPLIDAVEATRDLAVMEAIAASIRSGRSEPVAAV